MSLVVLPTVGRLGGRAAHLQCWEQEKLTVRLIRCAARTQDGRVGMRSVAGPPRRMSSIVQAND